MIIGSEYSLLEFQIEQMYFHSRKKSRKMFGSDKFPRKPDTDTHTHTLKYINLAINNKTNQYSPSCFGVVSELIVVTKDVWDTSLLVVPSLIR